MNNIKYTDAPDDISEAIEIAEPVVDFLSPPEAVAENLSNKDTR